ncbi:MAG: diaminopimelate epimerase [Streptosporangiaceae bacterium]
MPSAQEPLTERQFTEHEFSPREFAKGHGTENDFVILPDPRGERDLTPAAAARLCDRRAGIGADGVLRLVRTAALPGPVLPGPVLPGPVLAGAAGTGPAEWFMDYRNADGSIAEMCGNGIRVFARYLLCRGLAAGPSFAVATRSGVRQVRAEPDGQITVDMGPVTVLGPGRAVIGGVIRDGLRVSAGNPHLACLVDDALDKFDLAAPPGLDPADFPDGGNVELVRRTGPDAISMRVHERGSGETRSCGTGAVAAAAAAAALFSATKTAPRRWHVTVPGGGLLVTLEAGTSWLTGPAVIVAEGELDPDWLAAG